MLNLNIAVNTYPVCINGTTYQANVVGLRAVKGIKEFGEKVTAGDFEFEWLCDEIGRTMRTFFGPKGDEIVDMYGEASAIEILTSLITDPGYLDAVTAFAKKKDGRQAFSRF